MLRPICFLAISAITTFVAPHTFGQNFDTVINVPPTFIGDDSSIDSSTQLNVFDGGYIGVDFRAGATNGSSTNIEVNINGGRGMVDFFAYGSETDVNIYGDTGLVANFEALSNARINIYENGIVRRGARARDGGEINILGGVVDDLILPLAGGTVNVSSGYVDSLWLGGSSTVNITGGEVGYIEANNTGDMNISGGFIREIQSTLVSQTTISGGIFDEFRASDSVLVGGDFRLDGEVFTGSQMSISLVSQSVFTGRLLDGSTFVFAARGGERFFRTELSRVELPEIDTTPLIADGNNSAPLSLASGQTLTVREGGSLSTAFASVGATLNIQGGSFNRAADFSDSVLNIAGGSFSSREFRIFNRSHVNMSGGTGLEMYLSNSTAEISGGTLRQNSSAINNSSLTVASGEIGDSFRLLSGSTLVFNSGELGANFFGSDDSILSIAGGVIGDNFQTAGQAEITGAEFSGRFSALDDAEVTISGGRFDFLRIEDEASLNLIGSTLVIDGVDVTDTISFEMPYLVGDREIEISGTLLSGEEFRFFLNSDSSIDDHHFFSATSSISFTRFRAVPEPVSSACTFLVLLAFGLFRNRK